MALNTTYGMGRQPPRYAGGGMSIMPFPGSGMGDAAQPPAGWQQPLTSQPALAPAAPTQGYPSGMTRRTNFDTSWATPAQMAQAQQRYTSTLDPALQEFMGGYGGGNGTRPFGFNDIIATQQFQAMGILPPTAAAQRRATTAAGDPAYAGFLAQYNPGQASGGAGAAAVAGVPAAAPAPGAGGASSIGARAASFLQQRGMGGGNGGQAGGGAQAGGAPAASSGWLGGGNPSLSSYAPSPYLQQQIDGLQTQYNDNLTRNVLPRIQSGAIASGGYGGSKQGIAEGLASGEAQKGFASAATGLLGADYEAQMGRNLSRYGMDQNYGVAQRGLDLGFQNSANALELGRQQNANTRYGIDQSTGLGYTQAANTLQLGQQSNANQRYGMDLNYGLGQGQLGLGYLQAGNNFLLGQGGLDNQRYGIDTNAGIAQGQLGLGYTQAANQRYGMDLNYGIGQGQLANQRYGMDQNYYLGNQGQMLNFYGDQRNQDRADAMAGAQMYGMGTNGQWAPYLNANSIFNGYTGYGNTTTSGQSGGGWLSALGGAGAGYQLSRGWLQ